MTTHNFTHTSGASATREGLYRQWYGWQPSTAQRCPRVAAGKRCLAGTGSCVCREHRGLLEHPAIWHSARGTVYSADPLGPVDGVALGAFVADATKLGLAVTVSARSGWAPGRTVLIEARKADSMTAWLRTHRRGA